LTNKKPANLTTGRGQVPGRNGLATSPRQPSREANFSRHVVLRRLAPGPKVGPKNSRRCGYPRNIFVLRWQGRRQAQVRVRRLSTSRENLLRTDDPESQVGLAARHTRWEIKKSARCPEQ